MNLRLIGCLLALACLGLQSCISIPGLGMDADRGKLTKEVVQEADRFWTGNQILMIPISGMVQNGSMRSRFGEPGMLVGVKDRLEAAAKDKRIKAVILRVESPGGSVTASDLIYNEINRYRDKTKWEKDGVTHTIPIIAAMGDTAASGGFYISMGADEIYALPTTITGSIGVITMLPGIKDLSNKVGVDMRIIKSGPVKDIGSMWRDVTPQERKIFEEIVNKYYEIFLGVILDSRRDKGLTEERLRAIADGRIIDSNIAVNEKLIDGIKYPQEVFDRAKELAGIKDASLVTYEYPYAYRGNIYAMPNAPKPHAGLPGAAGGGGDFNLFKLDMGSLFEAIEGPKFMYLWLP